MHGEMKQLTQGHKLLLETGQGCYSQHFPVSRRKTCEIEEGEEEREGLFLMHPF